MKEYSKGFLMIYHMMGVGKNLKSAPGKWGVEVREVHNKYITTLPYSNATQSVNIKAIGEELSEISYFEQSNIYIFIYIDFEEENLI